MRKYLVSLMAVLLMVSLFAGQVVMAAPPDKGVTIQDGVLKYQAGHYLAGQPLMTGEDIFGYNYQAMRFSGSYANAYLGKDGLPPYDGDDAAYLARNPSAALKWYWPYRADRIDMKWNGGWLDNVDRDRDGLLDRHFGFRSYIGSGAWLTNHQWGVNPDGSKWDYFCKIVAVPADARLVNGVWMTAGGKEIGYTIWGEFAVTQEVYNDPAYGYHGLLSKGECPGFGLF
jgi:hypothetical protein